MGLAPAGTCRRFGYRGAARNRSRAKTRKGFPARARSFAARLSGLAARQVAEEVADALDRLGDRLQAIGVGKPDVVIAERAEAGAGDRRQPGPREKFPLGAADVVDRHVHRSEAADGTVVVGE